MRADAAIVIPRVARGAHRREVMLHAATNGRQPWDQSPCRDQLARQICMVCRRW